ncbi:MAG: hypothetical protein RIC55_07235 [Pirellulaceae bacterium]
MLAARRLFLACVMFACWIGAAVDADAAGPTYLILQSPPHGHYKASPHMLQPQQYAYGWFGAQPSRRFKSRHHGYYGNYTQWSYR